MEQAQQNNNRIHIRVTKIGAGEIKKLELMDGQLKIKNLSRDEVIDLILQFTCVLRDS